MTVMPALTRHKLALSFEDGVTRFIDCLDGEKIADAAYRHGINIPLDCREGACGTCKAHLDAGPFELTDYVAEALSPEEAARGQILCCKTTPLGDCIVSLPVESGRCLTAPPAALTLQVAAVEPLADAGFLLELTGDALAGFDFLPGQYAHLSVPGTDQHRAYSFSALPDRTRGRLQFLIRRVAGGVMSRYLAERAQIGDSITLRGPLGGFYLRRVTRPLLLLAGGTGLAPFLAMLERLRDHSRDSAGQQPVHLIYGVNREEDLVAIDRLDGFTTSLPGFSYTTCLATPHRPAANTGFVTDFLTPDHFHGGNVDVYLCGPPPMVEAVERLIASRGPAPASLHYEKFLASR